MSMIKKGDAKTGRIVAAKSKEMKPCSRCSKLFPASSLSGGVCPACK